MDLKLQGRVAFVTGASRGIGKAISAALAAEGVSIGLFGRDLERMNAAAQEFRARRPDVRAAVIELDLSQPKAIRPAVEKAIAALGRVDILVNCAGGAYRGRLEEIPDDLWESYFAIKPFGLIRMTRETVPHLRKSDQGRVINISGTRGREPQGVQVMSGPINLGTLSITKAMANEFGKNGITVNDINPGYTETIRDPETHPFLVSDDDRQRTIDRIPIGRGTKPEEIAFACAFLCSAPAMLLPPTQSRN